MSVAIVPETWRPVVENDYYDVSDLGNVRTWNNNGHGRSGRLAVPRLLKQGNGDGRPLVILRDKGRKTTRRVSVLVAAAFLGPRPPGMLVCHKDDVPSHNWVGNLRYGTRASNEADKIRNGTTNRGERNGRSKLTEPDVRKILKLLAEGVPQHKIGTRFNVHQVHISLIFRGKLWKHLPRESRPAPESSKGQRT